MRDNGLNATYLFQRYLDYWKQWCENLYNADAMGYVNTGHFTKAYGDKLQLSKYFYDKRSRYLDSKFCCGASIVNNLRLRLYEQGKGLAIKHYSPMYASVQWGANNFVTARSIDGDYALIPFGFTNPQNATFDIDDADMITDIKTFTKSLQGKLTYSGFEGLGNFYFDSNMALCTRLTEFIMNYSAETPNTLEQGTAFDLSKMTLLQTIIVRNVQNLTKVIQIGSDIVKEIDFTGTPIKGIVLPENNVLTKMILPESIEELNLCGLDALTPSGLNLLGLSNIKKYHYASCRSLDAFTILDRIYLAGANPTDITMENVHGTFTSLKTIDKLSKINAVLTGDIILAGVAPDFNMKLRWVNTWGDIDDTANALHIRYTKRIINSVTVSGDFYIQTPGISQLLVTPDDLRGNTVRSIRWKITKNDYATIDERTGVVTCVKIGTNKTAKAEVNVIVHLDGGIEIEAHETLYFYQRPVKVGDIIYADGSYSDKLNKAKTPIGICFYISPDEKDRRMVSLGKVNWGPIFWGLSGTTIREYSLARLASEPARDLSTVRGINKTYSTDITQDLTTLSTPLLGYSSGEKMSTGRYNTLCIINQRNAILRDSNYNMEVPTAKMGMSEYQILKDMHSRFTGDVKLYLYYFSASACYAYQPIVLDGETLAEKFTAHNWYLMSVAEAKLISDSLKEDFASENNFMHTAVALGLVEKIILSGGHYGGTLETSQEVDDDNRCYIQDQAPYNWYKWHALKYVFAVCNF